MTRKESITYDKDVSSNKSAYYFILWKDHREIKISWRRTLMPIKKCNKETMLVDKNRSFMKELCRKLTLMHLQIPTFFWNYTIFMFSKIFMYVL